ncbi:MAG TPA: hypothetical protein GX744_00015 [Firmicutes bacterium]|jgi:hypothetical protein|nr:hypothetical protein [Bacillota bacterium]
MEIKIFEGFEDLYPERVDWLSMMFKTMRFIFYGRERCTSSLKRMKASIFRMTGNCIHQNGSRIRIIGKKALLETQKLGKFSREAPDICGECRTAPYGR